jgi:tetratricopeptide (TPR) repeat protein
MELTVDQALQKGIEAHKAGQAQEADKFYTAILQSQPKHPDANHNMGVLAVGIGNTQQALPFFKIAVKANPNIVQFWLSYIDALIEQGKISNARAVFNQAKDKGIKGEDFDQLEKRINDFGKNMSDTELEDNGTSGKRSNILDILTLNQATKLARKKLKSGFSEEAKGLYEDILSRFPKNKIANDGIKVISDGPSAAASKSKDPPPEKLQPLIKLYNQGQFQQSLDQIEDNLKRFPRSATLHNMCGSAHAELGNLNAAIESYKKAINIKPDRAEAYSNMGSVLTDKGELDAAIVSCKQAIKINPDSAEAYYNMGIALSGKGDLSATIESYRQALKIKPDFAKAYNNIGLALAGTIFTEPVPGLQEIITLLLNRKNKFRPSAISGAAISL